MKRYIDFSMLVFIMAMTIGRVCAQAPSMEGQAIELLKEQGFEEIRVLERDQQVVCTIERGLNRSPYADFHQALNILKSIYPPNVSLRIVLLEQGQAVYELAGPPPPAVKGSAPGEPSPGSENLEVRYADQQFFKSIQKETVHRPVRQGITLVIYPQLTLQNMHFYPVYRTQFNLAPALTYSPWRGMQLTGQLIFPLVNELTYKDDHIRPGFVTFGQRVHLPGLNELMLTAGNFDNYRYGVDLKWKKNFKGSRWSMGADMGLTGQSLFHEYYWKHGPLERLTWKVKGSYYLPNYQLRADLQAGQFIYGDRGARCDLYRHFGEVTIGVYAAYTDKDKNGGFHFALPLDPFHRRHAHRVRVMLPAYFDMEYNAANEFVYNRSYDTRVDENRSSNDLYPEFINNQLLHLKTKKDENK